MVRAMPGTLGLPGVAAALAAAVALPLAFLGPPGGDEPAHLYRTDLVRDGVLVWDGFWFGGHYPLASYSLLYYFAAAVFGNVPFAVVAIVVSAALFAAVCEHEWGATARWPALAFAVAASGPLFTGTYPYALGLAALLACLRAAQLGRLLLAALAAVLTLGFSPLAFLFLTLALLAVAAVRRPIERRAVLVLAPALAVAGGAQALALALFPHDATYPFFRPLELGAVLAAGVIGAVLASRSEGARVLAAFFVLWTVAALLAYLIPTPVGENVTRLRGILVPLMLLAAVLARFRPVWLVAPALVGALAYTLVPYVGAALHRGDGRPAERGFWEPALTFLRAHASPGERVEVVPTGDHWEAYWLPHEGFALARGWYRQLDYAENGLFYEGPLRADDYRAWLRRMGVRYVLLPDTQLGRAGEQREAELLRSGGSRLREVTSTGGWRIWEVPNAGTILPGGAVTRYGHDELSGRLPRAGTYRLAVRFTPYWRVSEGSVCLVESADGMTELRAQARGPFRLEISLLARGSATCPG
jgi:hypothetical protein